MTGSPSSSGRIVLLAFAVILPPLLVFMGIDSDSRLIGARSSDVLYDFYFDRQMTAAELSSGRLPMWNPHTMCGFPQIAAMQTGALYPVTMLLGQMVEPTQIWYWTVVVHGALLALFSFLWLDRGLGRTPNAAFTGTVIIALSSFFFLRMFAGHIAMVCSLPWLLAVLWRLERTLAAPSPRAVVALCLCVAMLIYSGYPLFLFYAGLIAAFRGVWLLTTGRGAAVRGLAAGAAGFVLGAAIGAPQLLPALELSSLAHRAQVAPTFATQFSLPPEGLLTLFAPGALGDGATTDYWGRWIVWESSAFFGVVALVLAVLGAVVDRRRGLPWIILAVIAVLLALGRYTGIYDAFLAVVPGADTFRAPNRYVLVATLAIAAAASAAIERLADGASRAARITGLALVSIAVIAGIVWATGDGLPDGWWRSLQQAANDPLERVAPLPEDDEFATKTLTVFTQSLGATALFAAAAGITLLVIAKRKAAAATGALALGLIVSCELIGGGYRYVTDQSDPRTPQEWAGGIREHLQRADPLGRVVSAADVRDIGRCEVAGIDHAGGYDPLMLARYGELMNAIKGKAADDPVIVAGHDWQHIVDPSAVVRLIGVRHRIAMGRPEPGPVPARQFPRATIYDVAGALPRAFVVGEAEVVGDRDARLARLLEDDFSPETTVLLEEEPPARHPLEGPTSVTTRRLDDDRTYEMTIDGPGGGFLVFTESNYPGWSCTIDGKVAEVLFADHAFQAVALPPGARSATFRFTSGPMMGGTWIAAVTAFLLAGWLLLASRKSKTEPQR